jgi:BNR/Asp-box repeat protein
MAMAQGGAGAATTTASMRLTQPVDATKADLNPDRTYTAPNYAVDPSNPLHIVGGYMDLRTRRCGLIRTLDGGATWKILDAAPANDTDPFCLVTSRNVFHAYVAFGRNSTLYYGLIGWDDQDKAVGAGNTSVLLGRSTDLGDSWQTTIVRNNRGKAGTDVESDGPMNGLVVDSHSGSNDIVYVGYRRSQPGFTAPNAAVGQPMIAVSTDGGRSFAEPVTAVDGAFANDDARNALLSATTTIPGTTTTTAVAGSLAAQPNQAANFGGGNASITIDSKGTVYSAWGGSTANVTPSPPTAYFLSKSTDHGKTWTVTQIAAPSYTNNGNQRLAWSSGGGPQGTLSLVAQGNDQLQIGSLSHIWYFRSTDGGKTWSKPKTLDDDDPARFVSQVVPNVTAAPNGRIDVAWWDTRDDPGVTSNDVYYTTSSDNGVTWSKNLRITDQTDNRRVGVWLNNFNMSTPPGIISTNAFTLFGWDDTRASDPATIAQNEVIGPQDIGGGTTDIYTSAVQFAAIGGGVSKAVKAVLAGVVGLLVVGLVMLIAALASRRRLGPPGAQPVSGKASVKVT